ncbi:MAG: sugar transferase [Opitutales bacterium]|nr:sugar transferase [Opitutales bacterium]
MKKEEKPGSPEGPNAGGNDAYWASALLSKEAETWNRRARRKRARWRRVIALSNGLKRVVDVVGSLCAILLLSPVFLFTAWAIKREDGGPILFKQMRVGERGRHLRHLRAKPGISCPWQIEGGGRSAS